MITSLPWLLQLQSCCIRALIPVIINYSFENAVRLQYNHIIIIKNNNSFRTAFDTLYSMHIRTIN